MAEKGKAHQLEINLANPNPMEITQPPPEKLRVAKRLEYFSNCHYDKQAVALWLHFLRCLRDFVRMLKRFCAHAQEANLQ